MEVQHLTDDVQDVLASLLGWNVFLYLVGEEHHPNFVVVLNGTESDCGGYLRHHVALQLSLRAEVERAADVDEQHDGQLALFLKDLDVGTVETCRHIPVNVAHVVAVLVLAHLAEGHTAPLEGGMVLPRKDVGAQSTGFDFNLPYLFQYLSGFH